jgi:predicted dinucleotide-binding enzyme
VPSRTAVTAFNTHREKNGMPIVFRNVGILGTGPTGRAIAHRVVSSGVPVLLASTRGQLSMAALCSTLGPLARAVSVGHAALADAVVLALPFVRVPELAEVVDDWTGRIVIDSTNQFATYTPRYGGYVDLGEETGSEWVARQLPGATVIKAFNTLTEATSAPTHTPRPAGAWCSSPAMTPEPALNSPNSSTFCSMHRSTWVPCATVEHSCSSAAR